jgi:hypothetical protein
MSANTLCWTDIAGTNLDRSIRPELRQVEAIDSNRPHLNDKRNDLPFPDKPIDHDRQPAQNRL